MMLALIIAASITPSALAQSGRERNLNAIELAARAKNIFPPALADAVSDEIVAEVDRQNLHGVKKSMRTLYFANNFYKKLKTGKFVGAPAVIWNGFDAENKRPTFLYRPSDFAYVTASGRRIQPGLMDTDGGSVPKVLHSVGSFNPWTYGPAFLIHDWIFVAHQCGTSPDNDIDFDTSANIMAEGIKTLMEVGFTNIDGMTQKFPESEDTLYLMYLAVRTKIARGRWDSTDSVNCR